MQGFGKEVRQFIEQHELISPGSRILVACSGGVDSMVLLHYLSTHQKGLQIEVGAVHVDHMLRGELSMEDGVLVQSFCEKHSIPFYGAQVPVPRILKEMGGNVQTVCREGRYQFFDEVMEREKYDTLATGHHADDQLETVLMQLAKGTSPFGMPIKRRAKGGRLIRPLLSVEKERLYRYASTYEVPFREDASNEEDDYMRNRFRHHVVPKMLEENPSLTQTITPLTVHFQEDERLLQQLTKEQLERHLTFSQEGFPSMDVKAFQRMSTALQRRAIPLLLNYLYPNESTMIYKEELILQILQHLQNTDGNVSLDLPNGFEFNRSYGQFSLSPKFSLQNKQKKLEQNKKVDWDDNLWFYWTTIQEVDEEILSKASEIAFFNLPESSLPLKVRVRQDGDRILLKGMSQEKRVSRLFIDEKIDKNLREQWPIIVTNEDVVCAVPGIRYSHHFTSQQETCSQYIFIRGSM